MIGSFGPMAKSNFNSDGYNPIACENDVGCIEGWVRCGADRFECLYNWLDSIKATTQTKAAVRKLFTEVHAHHVGVIKNLEIYEEDRGKGYSQDLMHEFYFQAEPRKAGEVLLLFLEADTGQVQAEGFDLIKWFEGWDFTKVSNKDDFPVMVSVLTPIP